jgi:hypothetical protein
LNEQINTYRDKSHYSKVHSPYLHRSTERSYDFNASGNSPLITVVTNQSNIDNYGNVGTIQIRTTGNNKIFSEVTEKTYSNDINSSGLTSIGVSLTVFSAGKFIRLKVFFLNPTKA